MKKNDWESYFNFIRQEQWSPALDILVRISAYEANNPLVYLKMGDVHQRLEESSKAVSAYHRSADILIDQGFAHKALALYKIILRLDPKNPDALSRSEALIAGLESGKDHISPPSSVNIAETSFHRQSTAPPTSYPEGTAFSNVPVIFSGMSEDESRRFLEEMEVMIFVDGQKVLEEGDSGDTVFVIKAGKAKVIAHMLGKEIELALLEDGDVFGEVAFLTGRPRTATVIASGSLEVYQIGRLQIENLIETSPEILSRLEVFHERRVRDTIVKITPKKPA